MAYKPVPHNQAAFLDQARKRPGFTEAYDALEAEYALLDQALKARVRDDQVARYTTAKEEQLSDRTAAPTQP